MSASSTMAVVSACANLLGATWGVVTSSGALGRLKYITGKGRADAAEFNLYDSMFFIKRYGFVKRDARIRSDFARFASDPKGVLRDMRSREKKRYEDVNSTGYVELWNPTFANHFLYDRETGISIASLSDYLTDKNLWGEWNDSLTFPEAEVKLIQSLIDRGYIFVSTTQCYTELRLDWVKGNWKGHFRYDLQRGKKYAGKWQEYVNSGTDVDAPFLQSVECGVGSPFFTGFRPPEFVVFPEYGGLNTRYKKRIYYGYYNFLYEDKSHTAFLNLLLQGIMPHTSSFVEKFYWAAYTDRVNDIHYCTLAGNKIWVSDNDPFFGKNSPDTANIVWNYDNTNKAGFLPVDLFLLVYKSYFNVADEDLRAMLSRSNVSVASGTSKDIAGVVAEHESAKSLDFGSVLKWVLLFLGSLLTLKVLKNEK